jgi:hypothetical protein
MDVHRRFKRATKIMLLISSPFAALLGYAVSDIDRLGLTLQTALSMAGWTIAAIAFFWVMMRGIEWRLAQMER